MPPTVNMGIPGSSQSALGSVAGGVTGKRVLLAEPRGYCAGVDRAVETVERALEKHGAPVYVRHEIVHNRHVVETLAAAGAVFVDETDEVPEGAIVVFDDFRDAHTAMVPMLRKAYNTMLRTARHRNSSVIQLAHTYAGGKLTSQALQSNKTVIFYPRSQQSRCVQFLRDYLQLQTQQAKSIVRRFAALDRWMAIQMHSPVCIYNGKYLVLL
mgnify:CR=1 FL=1